ncbi:leucyl aminopeptidase [Branchiibius cervicis]|uniref:Probable cytosol aminopeptidase n=1 Tax=Branchiibius cervicis TaxID=908252 RepID=A0ABW2AQY3_9MICO
MTSISLSDRIPARPAVATLAVLSHKQDTGARVIPVEWLSADAVTYVDEYLSAVGASGAADEVIKVTGVPGTDALVLVVGSGLSSAPGDEDAESVRRAAGSASRALAGTSNAALLFPTATPALLAATTEGALFGAYSFTTYKSKDAKAPVGRLTVVTADAKSAAARKVLARATAVAEQVSWARDLVNTPPLDLYPASFAAEARKHFTGTKVAVRVADEKALERQQCGGLIGVGRGSARPPRLVTLTYKPARAKASIVLVGKGITFDSGGLCLKPADGMLTMKSDMAGAAAVAAATGAIAALGLPIAVTTYLCLAENMTGADAQRPSDVVTMPNGKTVEIINTDAEGRLVMADGLAIGSTVKPDLMLDVATLTGAAMVALGGRTTAVIGNTEEIVDQVIEAAKTTGEDMWPMPLLQELRPSLDSQIADVKHTGERWGGAITAALFLQEFVGEVSGTQIPWAHLDIAGPSFNDKSPYGYTPAGGTGHGVRTVVALAESLAR